MIKKAFVFFCIFLFSVFTAFADFSLSGYYKSFFIEYKPVKFFENQSNDPDGMVSNHLRLNFSWDISPNLSLKISYDLVPRVENKNSDYVFSDILNYSNPYRAYDFKSELYPTDGGSGNFSLKHNLDRAFLRISLNFADIYIGRQTISWGSAKIVNPTDIFAPFSFNELDKEERRGVDAVRVRIPIEDLSEIDSGYVFGDKFTFEKSGFFVRGKFFALNTDFSLLAIGFQRNLLLGFDITRPLGGASIWIESAYVKNNFYDKDTIKPQTSYFRLSAGIDYNFKGLYTMLEYHYNGAGSENPENYLILYGKEAYNTGAVYLMGKNYVSIMTNYQLTGLLTNTNLIIYNISDNSTIISPTLEYNFSENVYINIGAFWGFGKKPEVALLLAPPSLQSEFGSYPDMIYSSFRIYF